MDFLESEAVHMRFYHCKHCGNIVVYAYDSKVPVVCCGEEMQEMVPGTIDASREKHVPVISADGNLLTVRVGSVEHPMEEKHYIEWIELVADGQVHRAHLKPGDKPEAEFKVKAAKAYAREYCNLHGLWKAEA